MLFFETKIPLWAGICRRIVLICAAADSYSVSIFAVVAQSPAHSSQLVMRRRQFAGWSTARFVLLPRRYVLGRQRIVFQ